MTRFSRLFALVLALAVWSLLPTTRLSAQSPKRSLPAVLQKAIAHYATLTSHSDSGTVTVDTGAAIMMTSLTRRVLEDTPQGYGDGKGVLRITFDYQPHANPPIDDSKFQFTVPTK